jgi:uncharacterized membrane protein HdeD (DUF308 family)
MEAEITLDPESARQVKAVWWVFFILGLITTILGVFVIIRPFTGAVGLAILIAATLIVAGIADIIGAAQWRHPWVPIVWGVLSIAAGIAALAWPDITLWALAVLIGIVLIVRGALRTVASIAGRGPLWGFWLIVGLVELAAGVLAMAWPEITIFALAVVIGIDLVIVGVAAMAFAFRTRSLIT